MMRMMRMTVRTSKVDIKKLKILPSQRENCLNRSRVPEPFDARSNTMRMICFRLYLDQARINVALCKDSD